jgi:hypothetical protein
MATLKPRHPFNARTPATRIQDVDGLIANAWGRSRDRSREDQPSDDLVADVLSNGRGSHDDRANVRCWV